VSFTSTDGNLCNLKAVSESLPLKRQIFSSFSQILRPDAILASNTSSISITKIAAAAVPEGASPAGDRGKKAAGRVVGQYLTYYEVAAALISKIYRASFL
jgi:3-hydroxyacyl-CoA dehydrogenase, NAD binding domain